MVGMVFLFRWRSCHLPRAERSFLRLNTPPTPFVDGSPTSGPFEGSGEGRGVDTTGWSNRAHAVDQHAGAERKQPSSAPRKNHHLLIRGHFTWTAGTPC